MMFKIRKAIKSDTLSIVDFQKKMAMETEGMELQTATVTEGVKAVFEDINKGIYVVAESGGETIASLMLTYEWSDWRNATMLWIQSVFVKPDFRKQGVFYEMYDFIKTMVLESDEYTGLRLYVEKDNIPAQKVYDKIGMDGEHYKMFEWQKN